MGRSILRFGDRRKIPGSAVPPYRGLTALTPTGDTLTPALSRTREREQTSSPLQERNLFHPRVDVGRMASARNGLGGEVEWAH
jgi:hypothetical protein